jgi:hypothetical protein
MKSAWLLVFLVAVALGGCSGLQQYPDVPNNYEKALQELDPAYQAALEDMYNKAGNPDAQKAVRNKLIEQRMAVIDEAYRTFEAGLTKENVAAELAVALAGVGVGAAGSLAAESASQILSAVSGGLAGAQAAYQKSALYDRAATALLAQMRAGRKVIAAQIFSRWKLSIEEYPLWLARSDLEAYIFAGSLPGAIVATAADASVKEREATSILMGEITKESVTPEMFDARAALKVTIDGLDADKAKALITIVKTEFAAAPGIVNFIDEQYPEGDRAADQTGSKAKTVLKRAVNFTAKTAADVDKWNAAIANL